LQAVIEDRERYYIIAPSSGMDEAALGHCVLRLKMAADAIERANPGADPVVKGITLEKLAGLLGCGASPRALVSGCEEGHWIDEVLSDGSVIVLEDGARWLVDQVDRVDTALWLPVSTCRVGPIPPPRSGPMSPSRCPTSCSSGSINTWKLVYRESVRRRVAITSRSFSWPHGQAGCVRALSMR
jgi:hypothetical protein